MSARNGKIAAHLQCWCGKLSQKNSIPLTDAGPPLLQFAFMGFYEERPPRHGHRTPAELAEDEILSALHGDFCAMPEASEKPKPKGDAKRVAVSSAALRPGANASHDNHDS
jgi:hypothetical protein